MNQETTEFFLKIYNAKPVLLRQENEWNSEIKTAFYRGF